MKNLLFFFSILSLLLFLPSCGTNYSKWQFSESYEAAKTQKENGIEYDQRQGYEGRLNSIVMKDSPVDFELTLETYDVIKYNNDLPLLGFTKVLEIDILKDECFELYQYPGYYFVTIKIGNEIYPMEGQPFRPAEAVNIKPYFMEAYQKYLSLENIIVPLE